MQQRSEEWYQARLGIPTASRISDIMSTTKTGVSASYKNYMAELIAEKLTGKPYEGFFSNAMQRGIDLEALARFSYEIETGNIVKEIGFCKHPEINMGASPDGLVGEDGLIEIKCPNTTTHLEIIQTAKIQSKYIWQMQCQMECTNREWCDFVSFDDRVNIDTQLVILRVYRDEKAIKKMLDKVKEFNEKMEADIQTIRSWASRDLQNKWVTT